MIPELKFSMKKMFVYALFGVIAVSFGLANIFFAHEFLIDPTAVIVISVSLLFSVVGVIILTRVQLLSELDDSGIELVRSEDQVPVPDYFVEAFDEDPEFNGAYLQHLPDDVREIAVDSLNGLINGDEINLEPPYEQIVSSLTRDSALELLAKPKSAVSIPDLYRLKHFLTKDQEFLGLLEQNEVLYRNAMGLLERPIHVGCKVVPVVVNDDDWCGVRVTDVKGNKIPDTITASSNNAVFDVVTAEKKEGE